MAVKGTCWTMGAFWVPVEDDGEKAHFDAGQLTSQAALYNGTKQNNIEEDPSQTKT